MTKPRVLLLSGYDARSHAIWRLRLQALFPAWRWTVLSLPPRHFTWRIRSNAMQWATQEAGTLNQSYDLVLATSMVDLASLRGLIPALSKIPTLLYFHENQFAYPEGRQRNSNLEPVLVPIYAALSADRIAFNTKFNRDTFGQGVRSLSKSLPEPLPAELFLKIEQAALLPVPLPVVIAEQDTDSTSDILEIVWNHRWEYDKGPGLLLSIIRLCQQAKLRFRFHIVGQQFRERPEPFTEIESLLSVLATDTGVERGAFGYLEDESEYLALLGSADVVLSTALHDFQGLAIQEACLQGCRPLAPDALAYPEYLPADSLYPLSQEPEQTAQRILDKLQRYAQQKKAGENQKPIDLSDYQTPKITARYAKVFEELLGVRLA
ncbi:MAG: DUF3524 domain-containing protein [Pseudomonadales bacterium]|nr:DUF3524 domain-containing protein [Pseudomonadales bacterium]